MNLTNYPCRYINKNMKKILTFFLFLAAYLEAADNELFLKAGGACGRYIGLKENYLETGIWYAPDIQDNWVPLVDTSFYLLENDTWAASAGIGFRWTPCDCTGAFGANLYYDCRRFKFRDYCNCEPLGKEHHFLNRIGIGVEWLSDCFDARVNGYIPIGNSRFSGRKTSFNQIGNGYFASYRKYEFNLYGVDGEIGYRAPIYCGLDLYAAIGGYYYGHREIKDIIGPQARLALLYSEYIELEGIYTYDRVNGNCLQGKVLFSIPLDSLWDCFECSSDCFNFLKQPIKRNGIIFTERRCCWNYNW